MAKLFVSGQRPDLNDAVRAVSSYLTKSGPGVFTPTLAKSVASMESLDAAGLAQLKDVATNASTTTVVEDILSNLKVSQESQVDTYGRAIPTAAEYLETRRNNASREAAAIIMMASGDPQHYNERALSMSVEGFSDPETGRSVDVLSLTGANGDMQYVGKPTVSFESYDENELRKHIAFSTVFAAATARQADFAEAFFPTYVVSPEQIGTDVRIRRTMVLNKKVHPITGKPMDLEKVNLLKAFRDHTILSNESTQLVPVYRAESASAFVDTTKFPTQKRPVEGIDVDTAPLKFGTEIDLLGVSQSDALLKAGVIDQTDAIDAYARLDNLYITVGDQIVGFNVRRAPRAGAVKSVEGDSREMNWFFATQDLILTADTKDHLGVAVPELVALNNYKFRLGVDVTGRMSVEYGNITLNAVNLRIVAAFNAQDEAVSLSDAAVAALISGLGLAPFGYDLFARRNNGNRRSQGLLIDVTEFAERYTVPISSPLATVAPLSTDKSAKDLQGLINAANVRTNNNAVTLLLNYADDLKVATATKFFKSSLTSVTGLGRLLIEPTYKYLRLDMSTVVNGVQSAQRAEDIQGALITPMRNMAYELVRDSNYQAALDAESEGRSERPHLVIGTDIVTQQFLMVTGDDRTMGIGMDHTIVTTPDIRMVGKIFMTFVRKNTSEPDALSFGSHIYIPELTSVVPVPRNGAVNRETAIQMRNLQITNLPILGEIDVVNLDVATAARTALDVNTTAVTTGAGAGVTSTSSVAGGSTVEPQSTGGTDGGAA